ncbi:hypothetical protein ACFQL3_11775 [Natronoarchaeum sp. GCM10025321]|uniref:DUF7262 family protein n=1 Tax=Natronoarchaeum sp. GCM10025321 TaxID=3252684 RepID=UPI0036073DB7
MGDRRGQLSTPVVEAGLGVILIFAVVSTFALGVPGPDTQQAQLGIYAEDTATVLSGESPQHQDATRLTELARSEAAFDREHERLDRRLDRLLPDNLLYQVETEHGVVGMQRPSSVSYGSATVPTEYGDVTVRVWYA